MPAAAAVAATPTVPRVGLISDSVVYSSPSFDTPFETPAPIRPAESQDVSPASSPPGRIFKASENREVIPSDIMCFPVPPIHFWNGFVTNVSNARLIFPLVPDCFHSRELVIAPHFPLSTLAFASTSSMIVVMASDTSGIIAVSESTTPRR